MAYRQRSFLTQLAVGKLSARDEQAGLLLISVPKGRLIASTGFRPSVRDYSIYLCFTQD
jgi:hypothetical protein